MVGTPTQRQSGRGAEEENPSPCRELSPDYPTPSLVSILNLTNLK